MRRNKKMMYPYFMPPYYAPQQQMDPIGQLKAFSEFINEWNEKNKKKDEKKDNGPKINWAQSMLFMLFVMPIVGISVSAFQFYVFGRIFASFLSR